MPRKKLRRLAAFILPTLATSLSAVEMPAGASSLPKAQDIPNRLKIQFFKRKEILQFGKKANYHEPEWVTNNYVKTGKLPPVEERLPEEPMILMAKSMPDGVGEYGGVFRHVIGGRPQGWNWSAAQTQGWGGINYTVQECLTRTGPMYQLKADDLEVLPNLARSWTWSEDGRSLTMNLIKGAKWSDGNDFDSEDVRFYWEDTVLDPKVPSFSSPNAFGKGAKLEVLDKYIIRWTFDTANSQQALYNMAFLTFCPGPSHILKAYHPKFAPNKTYDDFNNALPSEQTPAVTMGAWVPVEFKSDQIVVLRRNPYFWKVDEEGNQLPYIDEMHFKLSTWNARTLETIAGTADMSNMESPPMFIETLRKLADKDSPAKAMFGPRNLSSQIQMNMNPTLSVTNEREGAIRQLNRTLKFRKAISHAIDRNALAKGMVRGPFAAPYAGGLHPETSYYDENSVVYYGYNPDLARQYLTELGLKDTDGNGIRNFTSGKAKGQDLEIVLNTGNQAAGIANNENLVSMMAEVGIKLIPRPLDNVQGDSDRDTGSFDWRTHRGEKELIVPLQRLEWLAPITNTGPLWHRGTDNDPQQLQPFEIELQKIANEFVTSMDPVKQKALMYELNRITTENVYHLGLVSYPGALLMNKRIKNVPNAPIIAYQWAEDAVMRERFWVAKQDQIKELKPNTLPEYQ
ncbi:ABC transporter substrate-binding protein [Vibrio nomapromontoriensis]|uniref:ABC transporter substrate-binding protein n=1 Tax=Vibrio nomapromontoriensis TaxID=2910246 RepID=UPI003D13D003